MSVEHASGIFSKVIAKVKSERVAPAFDKKYARRRINNEKLQKTPQLFQSREYCDSMNIQKLHMYIFTQFKLKSFALSNFILRGTLVINKWDPFYILLYKVHTQVLRSKCFKLLEASDWILLQLCDTPSFDAGMLSSC